MGAWVHGGMGPWGDAGMAHLEEIHAFRVGDILEDMGTLGHLGDMGLTPEHIHIYG